MKTDICLKIDDKSCIRCGRCVRVCPSQIFEQKKPGASVSLHKPQNCIVCGHCVAACPTDSVCHGNFPPERVHKTEYAVLPTPEQMLLLCRNRRSERVFTEKPVPQEMLELILDAADRAPTATNARQLSYTVVTNPVALYRIREYTLSVFGKIIRRLSSPLVSPWLRFVLPGVYRYLPTFKRLQREHEEGRDRILRGATAVIFIHAPKENRFGAEDANLAYQNASLMAESLGVGQVYMGFVLIAMRQDKESVLAKQLGIEGHVCAIMALGMPEFRYPKYIDREKSTVNWI